jgi:hypothetical protein
MGSLIEELKRQEAARDQRQIDRSADALAVDG